MANPAPLTTPPHNLEAEESVIGAVLIDPISINELSLTPEDFYLVKHRWIWEILKTFSDDGRTEDIDLFTVQGELNRRNQLADIGGPAYLTRLISLTVTSFNAPAYAKLVQENAVRRRLIQSASEIAKLSYDAECDLNTVIIQSEAALMAATTSQDDGQVIDWKSALSDHYDLISSRSQNPNSDVRLPTQFIDLDKMLGGGLKHSYCLMVAGEPGKGKTLLTTQVAVNLATAGYPGVIYSLEMTREQLLNRIISWKANIDEVALETGQLSDDDWTRYTACLGDIEKLPLFISDGSNWTTNSLRSNLVKLKQRYGIQWFVLDYFRLLNDKVGDTQNETDAYISRRLKFHICKRLDLCGVVVHTLNKAGMNGALPSLSSLSGNGQISYDMDAVLFVVDQIADTPQNNIRTLMLEKNRFGTTTGTAELVLLPNRPALVNATTRHIEFVDYVH